MWKRMRIQQSVACEFFRSAPQNLYVHSTACRAIRMMWMSLICSWIMLLGVSPSTFLFGCKNACTATQLVSINEYIQFRKQYVLHRLTALRAAV